MFTIEKQTLLNFLNLIRLKGENENKETVLNFTTSNITSVGYASDIIAVKGSIDGSFDKLGNIGIGNILLFIGFIKSLKGDNISIDKKDNYLILSTEKTIISYISKNPRYIKFLLTENQFNEKISSLLGNEFVLTAEQVKSIYTYFNSMFPASASKANIGELTLEGEDKELKLYVESNENKILSTFDISNSVTKFKVKLARVFVDLISTVNDNLIISVKEAINSPIYLKTTKENPVVEYIVAPMRIEE